MSHAPKNNSRWKPSSSPEILRKRAEILKLIRDFFAAKSVMEVETPLLCQTTVTDPFIKSIAVTYESAHPQEKLEKLSPYYLQTSPEYAMKRLLAAGSGSIYQICKTFRHGEVGRLHNPEFTMLEWYRVGLDHHALMDEMDELLQLVLQTPCAKRYRYAELFQQYLNINPHDISLSALQNLAKIKDLQVDSDISDCDTWLNLLLAHCIEPHLGWEAPCFIYDFPASQALLAKTQYNKNENTSTASRFEVYVAGTELANGFHELQDASEQRKRFMQHLVQRQELGLETPTIDEYLLAALNHGLPDCAGVALGLDRLIMLATQSQSIADVLSFSFDRV